MPPSTRLWKVVLVVALLSLTSCTAKRSPSTAHARRAQSGGSGSSSRAVDRTPTAGRKAVNGATRRGSSSYDEDDDDDDYYEQQWSDSDSRAGEDAGAWDSSYSDDDSAAATASLSEDDFDDDRVDSQDWDARQASSSSRPRVFGGNGDNTRRRVALSPSSEYDTPSLDSEYSGEEDSLWGDEGEGDASWDTTDSRASRSRRGRRPQPSAWTGDGGSGRSNRAPRSGRRGAPPGRTSQGSMVRYQRGRQAGGNRGFGVRMPAVSGAAIAATLRRQMGTAREAMGQAGSLAASTSKKLKREVKLAVSGSWESALLKVTWPDDHPPDETLVDSLVEAVKSFKLDRDVTKNSAEHRVLLRKLWAKMSEPDWRTVSKAVYLFHTILRDLPREHHDLLRIFLGKMSREKDKKTGCRYFDLGVLCGVNEEGAAFRSFVDRYGTYVFKRADGFNARFQELDSMRSDGGWENVVTTLAKAQKAIDLGVACQPEPEEEMELTVLCLRSTADDVCQVWRRFHAALAWVVEEAKHGDLFQGVDAAVVAECLNEFKGFYTSRYDDVVAFLADAEELLGIYDLHSRDLNVPPAHTFEEASGSSDTKDQGDDSYDGDSYDEDSDDEDSDDNDDNDDNDDDKLTDEEQAMSSRETAASNRAAAFRASKTSRNALNTSGGGGGDSSGAPDSPKVKVAGSADGNEGAGAEESGDGDGGACEAGVVVDEGEATGPAKRVADGTQRQAEASGGEEQVDEEEDEDDGDEEDESEDEDYDDQSGGSSEEEEEEEEEEDSAEEGAVDENVDDLTYFDDATQPEGTDAEWNSY